MAQSQAFHCPSDSCPFSPPPEFRQSLPSQIQAISPFVDQLMRFIRRFRSEEESEYIEIAAREAITNAIVHGNCGDPEKRVYVTSRCDKDGGVSITIRDEGRGFDSRAVPDPTAPENRLSPHGRGIYVMHALMDEVRFEEGGTVVKMLKKAKASSPNSGNRNKEVEK